jgi:hypothetical protein
MRTVARLLMCMFVGALLFAHSVVAAPSPDALADEVRRIQRGQIADISTVRITSEVVEGIGAGISSTTVMRKVMQDGEPVLEVETENSAGSFESSNFYDDTILELIRNASQITETRVDGEAAYEVLIDDVAFLESFQQEELSAEEIADSHRPKEGKLWINKRHAYPHRMTLAFDAVEGGEMNVELLFGEVEFHRGLPVVRRTSMTMTGLESMISPEELAEAKAQMAELKAQLDAMPEAQRAMMESFILPQMEQFESMIDAGGMKMEMRVTDVSVE